MKRVLFNGAYFWRQYCSIYGFRDDVIHHPVDPSDRDYKGNTVIALIRGASTDTPKRGYLGGPKGGQIVVLESVPKP